MLHVRHCIKVDTKWLVVLGASLPQCIQVDIKREVLNTSSSLTISSPVRWSCRISSLSCLLFSISRAVALFMWMHVFYIIQAICVDYKPIIGWFKTFASNSISKYILWITAPVSHPRGKAGVCCNASSVKEVTHHSADIGGSFKELYEHLRYNYCSVPDVHGQRL